MTVSANNQSGGTGVAGLLMKAVNAIPNAATSNPGPDWNTIFNNATGRTGTQGWSNAYSKTNPGAARTTQQTATRLMPGTGGVASVAPQQENSTGRTF